MRIAFAAVLMAVPLAAHAENGKSDGTTSTVSTPAPMRAPAVAPMRAPAAAPMRDGDGIPDQLDADQRAGYRMVFAAIRAGRWADAQTQLDAMKSGPLHAIARAELYTAKDSPKVDVEPLLALITEAPELPQADQLKRMALARGATDIAYVPAEKHLVWFDSAPVRQRTRTVQSDAASTEMALASQPFVKADDGASAEAMLEQHAADMTPDALTEWQQKVAWIYYTAGDDINARRMAAKAQAGSGEWTAQGDWVQGLAAWRQNDCTSAGTAFASVSQRAADAELRSAGFYWASRAAMACDRPEEVAADLKSAAQYDETFYGLLARQALGIEDTSMRGERFIAEDWRALERKPNVRVAAALIEIGENNLADEVLRHQAKLGTADEHAALDSARRAAQPATDPALAFAQRPRGCRGAGRGALSRAQLDARWRLARRSRARVRPHASGIALQFGDPQRRGRDGADAGQDGRRDRCRPPPGRDLCQLGSHQAFGQHGDRPVLSRAAARFADDSGPAAQGDRGLQRRSHPDPGVECGDEGQWGPFALH